MAIKISGNTVVADDKSFNVGNFTTATRPASPETGTLIYNTDINGYEYYNGSSWSGFSAESPFEIVETGGTLLHTLDNPNAYGTGSSDGFGYSVAISGNRVIVGSYREDDSGGLNSGKAYIYDARTGNLLHTLHNPNVYSTSADDRFGTGVTIDGNYAMVFLTNEDDAGGSSSGVVYIYDVDTGNVGFLFSSESDGTGWIRVHPYGLEISIGKIQAQDGGVIGYVKAESGKKVAVVALY